MVCDDTSGTFSTFTGSSMTVTHLTAHRRRRRCKLADGTMVVDTCPGAHLTLKAQGCDDGTLAGIQKALDGGAKLSLYLQFPDLPLDPQVCGQGSQGILKINQASNLKYRVSSPGDPDDDDDPDSMGTCFIELDGDDCMVDAVGGPTVTPFPTGTPGTPAGSGSPDCEWGFSLAFDGAALNALGASKQTFGNGADLPVTCATVPFQLKSLLRSPDGKACKVAPKARSTFRRSFAGSGLLCLLVDSDDWTGTTVIVTPNPDGSSNLPPSKAVLSKVVCTDWELCWSVDDNGGFPEEGSTFTCSTRLVQGASSTTTGP
jgi:hypothetical protein